MDPITGHQIAAARVVLDLGQIDLANLAKIEVLSLIEIESYSGVIFGPEADVSALVAALEEKGIVFGISNGIGQGIWFEGEYW
ncbi:hypothetical protein [Phyllobacterium sp. YR531]|uniref:hypothetical protein n=1 Tax=Phyllobacterium sp. YR531 TaxID=1144343 RepID=UPI00026F5B55|nr:hypothetical protein [Phyllobacterium sp. YR531]EJN04473.1 hypothetical protein PMI41_02114 [Phyllobacterium sp. YR531]